MADEPKNIESLKQENAELRARLAKAETEADLYRKTAYAMLEESEAPLTDEEIHELMTAPRGQSLVEILDEYERMPQG